jgi:phospho-N-acetylmuramoyl-pentapeptide-transferase
MGILTPNLYIPFVGIEWKLSWVSYMIFSALVMVGTVNAVNITDGVDGLATGVTLPVCAFFAAISAYSYLFWDRTEGAPVASFSAALFGALVGFLIYNFHPAKVFMVVTGSLFLGGAVCGMAFAMDIPLILALVGIIYVLEALSDIIQVVYFKMTHGKRIFRMAPLHHHFEMGGWSEEKLFFIFSGITLICCIAAYFGVIDRYPVFMSH